MKTVFIVAGIWISLFAATAVVSHLLRDTDSNSQTSGPVEATDRPDNALEKLRSLPRRSQTELIELDKVEVGSEYPEFLSSLHTALLANSADRLRICKDAFMKRSSRARELVEFSFEARDVIDTTDSSIRLHDVIVERSSIALSEAEVSCLQSAMEGLSVGQVPRPVGRMSNEICFLHAL